MPKSILARVALLLPRGGPAHDQDVAHPSRALTLYDAFDLWHGAGALIEPQPATGACCDLRRDHIRSR